MVEFGIAAVRTAFQMLLEEIKNVMNELNMTGAKAFEQGKHDEAKAILDKAKVVTAFQQKVALLSREWDDIDFGQSEKVKPKGSRSNYGKLKKGLRTPEREFYPTILQVLTEMGGSGKASLVLDQVYEAMKGILKPVDEEPMKSEPHTPRWRNTARWARYETVKEGLLKNDSPDGVWEISEQGRKWLEQNSK